jgi:hypothetical protein
MLVGKEGWFASAAPLVARMDDGFGSRAFGSGNDFGRAVEAYQKSGL